MMLNDNNRTVIELSRYALDEDDDYHSAWKTTAVVFTMAIVRDINKKLRVKIDLGDDRIHRNERITIRDIVNMTREQLV
jgi:hypothetical protein